VQRNLDQWQGSTTMALNPIRFTSAVNDQFLKYQLTTFPLTDPDLAEQARALLRGPMGRSPLFQN
jgi:hypothetical protein